MVAGSYCWINFPDNQFRFAVRGDSNHFSHNQFGWHGALVASLRGVANDSNTESVLSTKATLDSLNSGRYSALAAAKFAVGRENPDFTIAHNRAYAVFLCAKHCHISTMVGRAGQPKGWPGSMVTGFSPLYVSPPLAVRSPGGELSKFTIEAAIMATVPAITQPEITVIKGQAVTSSLAVADYFTKRHDGVLKKIRSLECSPDFTARNFAVSEYTDATGRKLPCYQITRDGFAFLAMGFTGKRAAQFKESYITAFNAMEQSLIKHPYQADPRFGCILTDAQRLHDNLGVLMAIWTDNVQPLNPPIVVSGTVMDSYHRSGLIAADIARAMGRDAR
nr:Rha family phage regulatory protein [Izhakiella australiensis]